MPTFEEITESYVKNSPFGENSIFSKSYREKERIEVEKRGQEWEERRKTTREISVQNQNEEEYSRNSFAVERGLQIKTSDGSAVIYYEGKLYIGNEIFDPQKGKIEATPYVEKDGELGHAYRWAIGEYDKDEGKFADDWGILRLEEEETSHLENKVRAETGKVLRTAYQVPIVKNGKRLLGKVTEKNWNYRLNARKK